MGDRSYLITPNSKTAVFYSDITDNLDLNPLTGQVAVAINEQDVINSYRRLILQGTYDREYDDIGGNIKKLLFEPVTDASIKEMESAIRSACLRETRGTILQSGVQRLS